MTDEVKMEIDNDKPSEAPEPPKKKKVKDSEDGEGWEAEPEDKKDKDKAEKVGDDTGGKKEKKSSPPSTKSKPSIITNAGILMFVGAGFNLLFFILWVVLIGIFAGITSGFGCFCCFYPFISLIPILFEILFGIKLLGQNPKGNPFWVGIIEIVVGIFALNPLVFGIGIANMIMLLKKEAKDFLQ